MSEQKDPVLSEPARETETLELSDVADAAEATGLLDSPPEPAFDGLTRLAAGILEVPAAFVTLVTRDRQFIKSECGVPEPWAGRRSTPLTHSFCQYVAASGRPLIIKDARVDPRLKESRAITELGVVAYAGMPVTDGAGQAIGAFAAIDTEPRLWRDEHLEILAAMAVQTSVHITTRALARSKDAPTLAALERAIHAVQSGMQIFHHYGPLTPQQKEGLLNIEAGFQAAWMLFDRIQALAFSAPAGEAGEEAPAEQSA